MDITPLPFDGAYLISHKPIKDYRGYFMRSYDHRIFFSHNINHQWVQENQSLSEKKYTIRGLHFQTSPASETKLVRVIKGSVFDVFVDLRKHSKTYGKWYGIELSDKNHKSLLIPKGCAHGFCTLQDNTIIAYKVDAEYSPDNERTLLYSDPDIGIEWPIQDGIDPIISEKDQNAVTLKNLE